MNITTIANNFLVALRKFGYSGKMSAVQTIVSEGINNRMDLIKLFRNHPNWNEESLRIVIYDTTLDRKFYTEAINEFINYLDRENIELSDDVYDFMTNLKSQFFNEGMKDEIEKLNKNHPAYHLRTNMKTSKAIGKICREEGWDKLPEYNKAYSRLCDNINPKEENVITVISVNPIDFLLMSNGDTWDSCHNIVDGCHMAGTLSYIAGNDSFLYYTVKPEILFDESVPTGTTGHVTPLAFRPKCLRQVWGYKNGWLFQSRLYPQSNDYGAEDLYTQIRSLVQKVISECENKPNRWLTKKDATSFSARIISSGAAYRDWDYDATGSLLTTMSKIDKDLPAVSLVMADEQRCIYCGSSDDFYDNDTLYCNECQ